MTYPQGLAWQDLSTIYYGDICEWPVVRVRLHGFCVRHYTHPLPHLKTPFLLSPASFQPHLTKDDMFSVQVGAVDGGDEELGPVCVGARVSH